MASRDDQTMQMNEQEHRDAEAKTNASMTTSLPTRIRVVVRVRPKLPNEASHGTDFLRVHQLRHDLLNIVQCSTSSMAKTFQLDQVFDGSILQRNFYEQLEVDRMLRAVLDGYHATVFAYGQTGSGKTYTMEGYDYEKSRDGGAMPHARFDSSTSNDRHGLIPRAIFTLFELMAHATRDSSREFVVKCSYLQIYNEQILDLFNPTQFVRKQTKTTTAHGGGARAAAGKQNAMPGLRLRWSSMRDFYVENLRILECSSPDHVLQHFQDGIKHKIMASHNLNAASSRSHCIFTLYVESFDPLTNPNDVLQSKLALVDLAGSERVDKTGATGVTLQESIGINKSLFVLRQVIQALSDESTSTKDALRDRSYIPYRDSKLTSLLKYSLGGNAWTLMIACLSPSDAYLDENLSTLLYAAKAQSIANNPTKNEDPKTVQIQELKLEVESLRRQLAQAQEIILQFQQQTSSDPRNPVSVEKSSIETISNQNNADTAFSTPQMTEMSTREQPHKEPSTAIKLKLRVIDNVEMIKQLYTTEKQLHDRLKKQESRIDDLQHETRVLHVENQSLREKLEVLEYLLATQQPDDTITQEPSEEEEIPGYGTLMKTSASASSLPLIVPSAERIHKVIGKKGILSTSTSSNQEPQTRPSRPPAAREPRGQTQQPKRPKRPEAEAGLLSLSELRELLGGKKLSSDAPSEVPKRSGSGPRPSTTSTPHVHNENPTTSILSMLQQQKLTSGGSTIDKDPLESLSELNRLLRVKATLRRSSSFK